MDFWNKETAKSFLLPGGAIFLCALLLFGTSLISVSAALADFYYYAVFAAGILLAWRFHSVRVLSALFVLLLAHRALEFFAQGKFSTSGPGHIAFAAIAFLLPLNFILLATARDRGLTLPVIAPRLGVLFLESVFVAFICRPGTTQAPLLLDYPFLGAHHWTRVPDLAVLAFAAALGLMLSWILRHRKPVDSGFFWSLATIFVALEAGGVGRISGAYFATAGLILVSSIVENSYVLAYHDELTGLPSRRAFQDALLRLPEAYSVAAVDIDHFKHCNDTYGHDTGDQVLRMVAGRLARVTGGGQAYRVGGEEFTVLFPGKRAADVLPHVERLRTEIESSRFRLRGLPERRSLPRGPDRRTSSRRKRDIAPNMEVDGQLSVTVSIGLSEPTTRLPDVDAVIQAADKALYRAKRTGRNRVETSNAPARSPRLKRGIA